MRHPQQPAGVEILWLLAIPLSIELVVIFAMGAQRNAFQNLLDLRGLCC